MRSLEAVLGQCRKDIVAEGIQMTEIFDWNAWTRCMRWWEKHRRGRIGWRQGCGGWRWCKRSLGVVVEECIGENDIDNRAGARLLIGLLKLQPAFHKS